MTRSRDAHPTTPTGISAGARLVALAGLSLGVFAAGACSGDVVGGTRVPDDEDCDFGCEVSQDDDAAAAQGSGSGSGGGDETATSAATTSGGDATTASASTASGGGEGGGGGAGDGGAGGSGGS